MRRTTLVGFCFLSGLFSRQRPREGKGESMSRFGVALALLSLAVFTAGESRAGITNGGFESGMAHWTGFGGTAVTTLGAWGPTEGSYFGLIGTMLTTPGGTAGFGQGFFVSGGETLTFDLRQFTRRIGTQQVVEVRWFDSMLNPLGATNIVDFTATTSDPYDSGWISHSWTVPLEARNMHLRFSIDSPDTVVGRNYLGVDNVRLEAAAIPAPGAALLGLLGLGSAWLKRRTA